ncbi:hypothetical protein [Candidatus Ferrigenium straubiae]|jgi:hypothetical protein
MESIIIGILFIALAIVSDKLAQYGHRVFPIGIIAGILAVLVLVHAID